MPDDLNEHLDAVHEAAERLIREAATRIPPRGYEVPPDARSARDPFAAPELIAVASLVEALRSAVPAELSQQLREALRELLLALRALIDWYLEQAQRPRAAPADVQDIPID